MPLTPYTRDTYPTDKAWTAASSLLDSLDDATGIAVVPRHLDGGHGVTLTTSTSASSLCLIGAGTPDGDTSVRIDYTGALTLLYRGGPVALDRPWSRWSPDTVRSWLVDGADSARPAMCGDLTRNASGIRSRVLPAGPVSPNSLQPHAGTTVHAERTKSNTHIPGAVEELHITIPLPAGSLEIIHGLTRTHWCPDYSSLILAADGTTLAAHHGSSRLLDDINDGHWFTPMPLDPGQWDCPSGDFTRTEMATPQVRRTLAAAGDIYAAVLNHLADSGHRPAPTPDATSLGGLTALLAGVGGTRTWTLTVTESGTLVDMQ